MPNPDEALDVMRGWLGLQEQPLGSNRVPEICEEYGWCGVAWCAITVSVALTRIGIPLHEAAVGNIRALAQRGDRGWSWHASPAKGDLACFDFGGRGNWANFHVSMVEVPEGNTFVTIGGNEGDAVRRTRRDFRYVLGFARPPYSDQEEEDMGLTPEDKQYLENLLATRGVAGAADAAFSSVDDAVIQRLDQRLDRLEEKLDRVGTGSFDPAAFAQAVVDEIHGRLDG